MCVCVLQKFVTGLSATNLSPIHELFATPDKQGDNIMLQDMKIYIFIEPVIQPLEYTPMISPFQSTELFSTST